MQYDPELDRRQRRAALAAGQDQLAVLSLNSESLKGIKGKHSRENGGSADNVLTPRSRAQARTAPPDV